MLGTGALPAGRQPSRSDMQPGVQSVHGGGVEPAGDGVSTPAAAVRIGDVPHDVGSEEMEEGGTCNGVVDLEAARWPPDLYDTVGCVSVSANGVPPLPRLLSRLALQAIDNIEFHKSPLS